MRCLVTCSSLAGYSAGMSPDQRRKTLVSRTTTYLLGQVDVLPLGGFDSSANAMAQGPTRRARGEAFFKYVTETTGAKHQALIVSECGHNAWPSRSTTMPEPGWAMAGAGRRQARASEMIENRRGWDKRPTLL